MNSNGTEGNRVCEYVLFRPLVTVINVIKSILFDVSHIFFLCCFLIIAINQRVIVFTSREKISAAIFTYNVRLFPPRYEMFE